MGAIFVDPRHDPLGRTFAEEFHGPWRSRCTAFRRRRRSTWPLPASRSPPAVPVQSCVAGPHLQRPEALADQVLENKYGFDDLYQAVFARGSVSLGAGSGRAGDVAMIDGRS
jgi:NADH-quinone oxidoreductase subunit L